MAPKRTMLRPNHRNKAAFVRSAWARTLEARADNGTLRRLKNGLLDVNHNSAEYLDAIQANSESLLLRLPPEIKNCIWAYVLGGKVLDVKCFENYEKSHVRDTTAISQDSFPEYSHALLQVCRQIYTETALLPFSKNTFRFDMVDAFEWARHLLDVQRALLEKVHIVTNTTECKLLRYFPIDFFPGLKQIVVEVHPFAFQGWRYVVGQDPERYRTWFTANIGRMAKPIQEAKPDVRVTIMHVYTD